MNAKIDANTGKILELADKELFDPFRNPFHPGAEVICDVCLSADEQILGGVTIPKDADGTPSSICQDCWEKYTCRGISDTYPRMVARECKVAINPKLEHLQMDKTRTFRENVLDWRIKAGPNNNNWRYLVEDNRFVDKKESRKRMKEEPDLAGIIDRCFGCGFFFKKDKIKKCGRCQVVRYCSQECQKKHWPKHKPLCKKA